jgi:hypothetical protein
MDSSNKVLSYINFLFSYCHVIIFLFREFQNPSLEESTPAVSADSLRINHFEVFGPQPNNGKKRTELRNSFLSFIQDAFAYFPPYVSKNNPEDCLFPDDGSYCLPDFYNDLCDAVCDFCNGSIEVNKNCVSIFADIIPSSVSKRYIVKQHQLFFKGSGRYYYYYYYLLSLLLYFEIFY